MRVEQDRRKLQKRFGAVIDDLAVQQLEINREWEQQHEVAELKDLMGLKRKPSRSFFQGADAQGRIYPGYFADVMTLKDGKRFLQPMRYRVRPAHSLEEIPSKFNVFNARLDSLEKRKTWSGLFLRRHALLPFLGFYEWVENEGKKTLIQFLPKEKEIMWAPALYDEWQAPNGEVQFRSFAIITTDPPKEVLAMGHDRCPIFLRESLIDQWLAAESLNKEKAYKLLSQGEEVVYDHQWPKSS